MIKKGHDLTDEQIAAKYDEISSTIKEPETHYQNVLDEIKKFETPVLLEIGCGNGNLIKRLTLAQINKNYYGIDINDSFVNETRKWLFNPSRVQKGTVYEIPFQKKFFDVIILMDVIEHLKEPEKALLEIRSKLKTNGMLIVTVPNASAFETSRDHGELSSSKWAQYLFLPWEHPLKSKQPIDTMIYYDEYLSMFKKTRYDILKTKGWNYFPFLYSIPKINQIVDYLMKPVWLFFDKIGLQKNAYSLLFVLEKHE